MTRLDQELAAAQRRLDGAGAVAAQLLQAARSGVKALRPAAGVGTQAFAEAGRKAQGAEAQASEAMPGAELPEATLAEAERRHSAGLMRVNHVGEVCAQALYEGQALTARSATLAAHYREAALEERAHLQWTADRLQSLGSQPSRLNPLWQSGSLLIGAAAGLAGDRRSLGFMEETERQVESHLAGHLDALPAADLKSRAVVQQMMQDEAGHADTARELGAARLPLPVRAGMRLMSRVMTATAYRI